MALQKVFYVSRQTIISAENMNDIQDAILELEEKEIPESTSDLTNDSGFITKTVNDLANYFLKSETYSRDEINQKVSTIPKFVIQVVSSLPTTGISETTVYLLKTGDDSNNLYTEYIRVNGAWEYLGKQTVDLSGYALKTDVPTKLSALTNDAGFITNAVSNLVNYYKKSDVYSRSESEERYQPKGNYLTQHQDLSGYAKKATTLAGYGITDGATKTQLDQLSNEIANQKNDNLPDYWLEHLSAKAPSINTAMEAAGRNKSAFYFYTDAHRISSANMTPAILRYLYRHTSINKTNNGGDFFEPFATGADNLAIMRNYIADMRGVSNHHSVIGNHDEDNESLVSDAQLYGFYLAWEENNDIVWGGYHYYYIDNNSENTRYLYLDIGKNLGKNVAMVSDNQMQFVIDSLASLPEGWHIVPIAHIWYDYEIAALPDYVLNLLSVFDSYNGRTAGSVTHNGNAFAYDFAEALGNVEFCIGGHVHADQTYYSNGGIPIVIIDADSTAKKGSAATLGTITEGCVTAVVADYNTRKLKMIRIGRGSDRTIDIPAYKPIVPAEIVNILDTADIQYNKRYSPNSMSFKDDIGTISFLIPWADVWDKTIYFKGFSNITSKGGQVSAWRTVKGTANYGLVGATNFNIFTATGLQKNNDVYSIAVNSSTVSTAESTYEYLQIQFVLNTTNVSVSAADLANCIMTIDQLIE